MNRKIWKALGIAVCMLALAAPRAMAELREYLVSNNEHFADAVGRINNESNIGDENEIVLMQDITLEGDYILTNGKKTTIKGNNHTLRGGYNATIAVSGEKTVLNLGAQDYKGTLTIDGDENAPTGPFVDISNGATVNMYEHVTLQNGKPSGNSSVHVYGKDSVFNLCGGVIRNCIGGSGGGILVSDEATFVMSGGKISGCSAGRGGGLFAKKNSIIEISGGTIENNRATSSSGGGLYAENSTVTISGGTISRCTTSEAGMGGGLYAYKSTITISRGTIENNKATYGGGVALNSSTINPITNWTVIGNEAYQTKRGNGGIGGGIYLESRSMNVSAGSNRIYNNQAEGHGADICLEKGASITLPDAANMGATYRDSGIKIDNWYNDKPLYEPSESGQAVKELQLNGKCSLVASYKADPVRIEIDANGGKGGSSSQTVHKGTTVTLEAPTKEGHLFKGWKDEKGNSYPADADGKVKITVTGDMTLTAVWEARSFTVTYVLLDGKTRTETAAYGKTVTLGEEPRTGYTFVGWKDSEKVYHAGETITVTGDMTLTAEWKKLPSAENLPKTGDESPVLLWGAALAVSAAACFMLRRRK